MNRRLFLEATGKFGLALSLAQMVDSVNTLFDIANEPQNKKAPFFKLSLAQWSLHKAILEAKTLSALDFPKKAKELGFDAVEYVSALYEVNPSNRMASLHTLVKELDLRSKDHGVQNILLMVDNEGELAAETKSERDKAIDNHLVWVDAAAGLGCHSIRVNLFGTGAENDFNVWKETATDGLGRLAGYAAKSKINVIVENHGGMTSDAAKLTEVIKTINLKNCGTLPDFGNFCVKREGGARWETPCIEEYDRYKGVGELMPFAKGVSAKSYDFDAEGNETKIDYYKMLKIVKEAGFTGRIGVEYEGNGLGEEEGIKATKALLLKAAAKL